MLANDSPLWPLLSATLMVVVLIVSLWGFYKGLDVRDCGTVLTMLVWYFSQHYVKREIQKTGDS